MGKDNSDKDQLAFDEYEAIRRMSSIDRIYNYSIKRISLKSLIRCICNSYQAYNYYNNYVSIVIEKRHFNEFRIPTEETLLLELNDILSSRLYSELDELLKNDKE